MNTEDSQLAASGHHRVTVLSKAITIKRSNSVTHLTVWLQFCMLPNILFMLVVIRTVVKYNCYRPKFVSKKREYLWLVVLCWEREVGLSDWCITSGTPLIIDFPSKPERTVRQSTGVQCKSLVGSWLYLRWVNFSLYSRMVYIQCAKCFKCLWNTSTLYFYSVRITGILIRLPFINSTSVSSPPPIINAPRSIISRTGKGNEQLPLSRESLY